MILVESWPYSYDSQSGGAAGGRARVVLRDSQKSAELMQRTFLCRAYPPDQWQSYTIRVARHATHGNQQSALQSLEPLALRYSLHPSALQGTSWV